MAKKKAMTSPGAMLGSMDDDYRAEDDCRTLTNAEKIRGDRHRFGAARKHGKRQMKQMARTFQRR